MKPIEFIRKEYPMLLLLLIPFVLLIFIWNDLPAKMPTHWNFSGEVDQYTAKEIGAFLIPGLNVVMYILFFLLPRIDPKKDNYNLFRTSYNVLRFSILGFMFFLNTIILLASLGYDLNVGAIVINLTLVLFLVFGNFMGKLKSNYFVGFKTPWTLNDPYNWNKTHRFAGKLWVSASLIMIVLNFIIPASALIVIYFSYIAIIVISPVIYSYKFYLKGK